MHTSVLGGSSLCSWQALLVSHLSVGCSSDGISAPSALNL